MTIDPRLAGKARVFVDTVAFVDCAYGVGFTLFSTAHPNKIDLRMHGPV